MTIYKNLKGLRIVDTHGFVCGYANDPDRPSLDNHVFLMFNVLPENGLLDKQFEIKYGNAFVMTYIKNIDFKPYNIYVFKRDMDIINELLALNGIKYELPLEDDDSLYLPDDYSLTLKTKKEPLVVKPWALLLYISSCTSSVVITLLVFFLLFTSGALFNALLNFYLSFICTLFQAESFFQLYLQDFRLELANTDSY